MIFLQIRYIKANCLQCIFYEWSRLRKQVVFRWSAEMLLPFQGSAKMYLIEHIEITCIAGDGFPCSAGILLRPILVFCLLFGLSSSHLGLADVCPDAMPNIQSLARHVLRFNVISISAKCWRRVCALVLFAATVHLASQTLCDESHMEASSWLDWPDCLCTSTVVLEITVDFTSLCPSSFRFSYSRYNDEERITRKSHKCTFIKSS